MRSFEQHYARSCYEQDTKDKAASKRRTNRQLTREQRRRQTRQTMAFIGAVCMLLAALLTLLAALTVPASADTEIPETAVTKTDTAAFVEVLDAQEPQEDFENEKIEEALLARSHKLEDVTITFYCCEKRPHICGTGTGITASGRQVTPYVSCAVDTHIIPLGSTIMIEHNGEMMYLRADDTGSAIQGNRLDIAVQSHQEALNLGVKTADIWWCEE